MVKFLVCAVIFFDQIVFYCFLHVCITLQKWNDIIKIVVVRSGQTVWYLGSTGFGVRATHKKVNRCFLDNQTQQHTIAGPFIDPSDTHNHVLKNTNKFIIFISSVLKQYFCQYLMSGNHIFVNAKRKFNF